MVAASSSTAAVLSELQPVLDRGLVALCRARPAQPVEWLAEWLLANRPPPPAKRRHQPHVKARSNGFASRLKDPYPLRLPVPDEMVPWRVAWPGYAPTEFVMAKVLKADPSRNPGGKSYADAAEPDRELIRTRGSIEYTQLGCDIAFDARGRPLNPRGRTGLADRGALGKWGANFAADPMVTRTNKAGQLELIMIRRNDSSAATSLALPGGMVEAGEQVSTALRREFAEEATNFSDEKLARYEEQTAALFSTGELVYSGYVDDPRNTDHAWMETTAMHFHCSAAFGELLAELNAGSDATEVHWVVIDGPQGVPSMFADHELFVRELLARWSKSK